MANYGFLMVVISAFCWASYEVICKKQTLKEHFIVQIFCTFLFASILLLPWTLKAMCNITVFDFISLTIISLFRIINVILLFQSIRFIGPNWSAPVSYMKFPIMALLGSLFFSKFSPIEYWVAAVILSIINIAIVLIKQTETDMQLKLN
jgi:drug/metabolite transporter (DMT)-like permease